MGAKNSAQLPNSARTPRKVHESISDPNKNSEERLLMGYQKKLLRQTWKNMSKTGPKNIGDLVVKGMIAKCPEIKAVFQHVAVLEGVFGMNTSVQAQQHHSALIIELISQSIDDLNRLDNVAERCREYGAKHAHLANYGMKSDHWDMFGEAMMETASHCGHKNREAVKAWTVLISFLVDRMRGGFETVVKRRKTQATLATLSPKPDKTLHRSASCRENRRRPERYLTTLRSSPILLDPAKLEIRNENELIATSKGSHRSLPKLQGESKEI